MNPYRLRQQLADALRAAPSPAVAWTLYTASPLAAEEKRMAAAEGLRVWDQAWMDELLDGGLASYLTRRAIAYDDTSAPFVFLWIARILDQPGHPRAKDVAHLLQYACAPARRRRSFPDPRRLLDFGIGRLAQELPWGSSEPEAWLHIFADMPETREADLLAAIAALSVNGRTIRRGLLNAFADQPACTGAVARALWQADEAEAEAWRKGQHRPYWQIGSGALSMMKEALIRHPGVWGSASLADIAADRSLRIQFTMGVSGIAADEHDLRLWLTAFRGAAQVDAEWAAALFERLDPTMDAHLAAVGFTAQDLEPLLAPRGPAHWMRAMRLLPFLSNGATDTAPIGDTSARGSPVDSRSPVEADGVTNASAPPPRDLRVIAAPARRRR